MSIGTTEASGALAEAFKTKGITPRETAFNLAIAKFQNNSGRYEVALAMLDVAYGKGSGGHSTGAIKGPSPIAAASPNDGEVGHRSGAAKAVVVPPASPSPPVHVVPTLPLRSGTLPARNLPGHARRGALAIASVQSTMAKSAFSTIKLDDGRTIGEVRWSEAIALAQRHSRNARILLAAHNYAIPPDPSTPLGEIVPPSEQQNIVSDVEKINAH